MERLAPEWEVTQWLNASHPLQLAQLRGKVVFLLAFQMRCSGCVERALPQAQRVAELFAGAPLMVVGLHAVFENHQAMQPDALRVFLGEQGIRFPVGVDAGAAQDPLPRTMRAYAMQGTPTLVLIDARGRIRRQVLGPHDDLMLGAELQTLLLEAEGRVESSAGHE